MKLSELSFVELEIVLKYKEKQCEELSLSKGRHPEDSVIADLYGKALSEKLKVISEKANRINSIEY